MDYDFKDSQLLEEALTHTSFAYENGGPHNERLEFLGDAVLQIAATEILFQRFPNDREGTLHSYRARLVSTEHLAKLARAWELDQSVRLGKGEDSSGGRMKDRLLAGVFEAVLGAMYLDSGFAVVCAAIRKALEGDLDSLPLVADARKTLHEWCQQRYGNPPVYRVKREEGPPHARMFYVDAICGGDAIGTGSGTSKRTASISAAEDALTAGLPQ